MFNRKKAPIRISESTPLVIGGLSVYPERLRFKNRKCNFKDIESLSWWWFSQTINAINNQTVKLKIFISGSSNPIYIRKTTMFVTPKLVTAYEFIAKETFETRMKKYIDQLEDYGGFKYQDVIIYSDGRVVKNEKVFYLRNIRYEPFRIIINSEKLFSGKCKINTLIDRDVVLSLINYILKNPQNPEEFRENRKRRENN